MILLDSLYINNSGGEVLLDQITRALNETGANVFYLLDIRCKDKYDFLPIEKTLYLPASFKRRHFFYKKNRGRFSKVLCFGNLPPTIKLPCKVYTYFHNVLLLEQPKSYPFKQKISKRLKGGFIRLFSKNSDYFIIQSENVRKLLLNKLDLIEEQCLVIPFYRQLSSKNQKEFKEKERAFIYVSNGNPHKNHKNLLKAWQIINNKGYNIPLHLTISNNYSQIISEIDKLKERGIKIFNHGIVDISELYQKYRYSIYPSLAESFGLGLVESIEANCEVIAADLPYTHAIVEPLATFDPNSPHSIAKSVIHAITNEKNDMLSKCKIRNELDKMVSLLTS